MPAVNQRKRKFYESAMKYHNEQAYAGGSLQHVLAGSLRGSRAQRGREGDEQAGGECEGTM